MMGIGNISKTIGGKPFRPFKPIRIQHGSVFMTAWRKHTTATPAACWPSSLLLTASRTDFWDFGLRGGGVVVGIRCNYGCENRASRSGRCRPTHPVSSGGRTERIFKFWVADGWTHAIGWIFPLGRLLRASTGRLS